MSGRTTYACLVLLLAALRTGAVAASPPEDASSNSAVDASALALTIALSPSAEALQRRASLGLSLPPRVAQQSTDEDDRDEDTGDDASSSEPLTLAQHQAICREARSDHDTGVVLLVAAPIMLGVGLAMLKAGMDTGDGDWAYGVAAGLTTAAFAPPIGGALVGRAAKQNREYGCWGDHAIDAEVEYAE